MTPWLPSINRDLCTGCGECVSRCPTSALGRQAEKAALVHPNRCTYCAVCEDICPVGAIELPYLILKYEQREEVQNE